MFHDYKPNLCSVAAADINTDNPAETKKLITEKKPTSWTCEDVLRAWWHSSGESRSEIPKRSLELKDCL